MRLPLPGPCLSMELIDGGMNPVGEELPELDEQRLRSKRENGEWWASPDSIRSRIFRSKAF
jgi:hypothetical protein